MKNYFNKVFPFHLWLSNSIFDSYQWAILYPIDNFHLTIIPLKNESNTKVAKLISSKATIHHVLSICLSAVKSDHLNYNSSITQAFKEQFSLQKQLITAVKQRRGFDRWLILQHRFPSKSRCAEFLKGGNKQTTRKWKCFKTNEGDRELDRLLSQLRLSAT